MYLLYITYLTIYLKAIQEKDGLEAYLKLSNKRLEEIVIMIRGELSKMTRITIEALIVVDVHGICMHVF